MIIVIIWIMMMGSSWRPIPAYLEILHSPSLDNIQWISWSSSLLFQFIFQKVHFLEFWRLLRLLRLLRKQLTTYSSIPGDARFTITGYSGHPHGYLCSYQGIPKIFSCLSPFFKISFNGLSGSSWQPTPAYLEMLDSPSLHIMTNFMFFFGHEQKLTIKQ